MIRVAAMAVVAFACSSQALARDPDGRYANSPLKPWFETLESKMGRCCVEADGEFVEWETRGGRYFARVRGQWVAIPDEAIVAGPNLAGRAMIWVTNGTVDKYRTLRSFSSFTIKCFLPGPMV